MGDMGLNSTPRAKSKLLCTFRAWEKCVFWISPSFFFVQIRCLGDYFSYYKCFCVQFNKTCHSTISRRRKHRSRIYPRNTPPTFYSLNENLSTQMSNYWYWTTHVTLSFSKTNRWSSCTPRTAMRAPGLHVTHGRLNRGLIKTWEANISDSSTQPERFMVLTTRRLMLWND